MSFAVETYELTKRYGDFKALDRLNIKIESGQIRVLLGPNGSGKTTFLHLISTVLRPSEGTASVLGYDIVRHQLQVRQLVAIAFQDPRGFWRHKPKHILSFHASMYGVKEPERSAIVERTLKEFELWESRDKKFMDLSGGQAKRLEVAKLFVSPPKLALLDEPTAMVDLDGKRLMWDKIKELKERGSTVIVATNEVREAEYLADKITIFSSGRDVVTDTLSNLKDSLKGGDIVDLEFAEPTTRYIIETIKSVPGTVGIIEVDPKHLRVSVSRSEDWLPITVKLLQGIRLQSVHITEPSLDDVFMTIVKPKKSVD
ncbi:MAG: ABC transporter ATP-binding protein [Conexivisphaerales archaeon]